MFSFKVTSQSVINHLISISMNDLKDWLRFFFLYCEIFLHNFHTCTVRYRPSRSPDRPLINGYLISIVKFSSQFIDTKNLAMFLRLYFCFLFFSKFRLLLYHQSKVRWRRYSRILNGSITGSIVFFKSVKLINYKLIMSCCAPCSVCCFVFII